MGCGGSKSFEEKNNIIIKKKEKDKPKRKSSKRVVYKGVTILENVMENIPPTVTRDEIKEMVNNSLGGYSRKVNSEAGNKKLTEAQIEGIIDMIMVAISDNNNKSIIDKRLDDVKAVIGFYPVNKENIRNLFYKGQKPTEDKVEDMVNTLSNGNEGINILVIELI